MRLRSTSLSLLLLLGIAAFGSHAATRVTIDTATLTWLLVQHERSGGTSKCSFHETSAGNTMVCTYKDAQGSCATVATPTGMHSIGDHPGCPSNP